MKTFRAAAKEIGVSTSYLYRQNKKKVNPLFVGQYMIVFTEVDGKPFVQSIRKDENIVGS